MVSEDSKRKTFSAFCEKFTKYFYPEFIFGVFTLKKSKKYSLLIVCSFDFK